MTPPWGVKRKVQSSGWGESSKTIGQYEMGRCYCGAESGETGRGGGSEATVGTVTSRLVVVEKRQNLFE